MWHDEKKGLVSVIVPVYNTKKYLKKCIDSILTQTYTNIELILVDDGSSDGTSELCDVYATENNRIIVFHQLNKGAMAARVAGINVANGEYIGFVDSDDWIDGAYYKKMVEYMSYTTDVDVVISGMVYEGDKSMFWDYARGNIYVMNAKETISAMVSRKNFCWELCDKLYRKSLFSKVQFDTNITSGEDLVANILIFQHVKKAVYASLHGYHYLRHRDKPIVYNGQYNPNGNFTEALQTVLRRPEWLSDDVRYSLVGIYICALINELNLMLFYGMDMYSSYVFIRHAELNKWIKYPHKVRKKEEKCLGILNKSIEDIVQIYSQDADRITNFFQMHRRCYIYGIGKFSQMIFAMVKRERLLLDGFVVSNGRKEMEKFCGYKVFELSTVLNEAANKGGDISFGIVMALNDNNANVVIKDISNDIDVMRPLVCVMQIV